jgi:diguanylate cyclase (GGDEF) domain
MHILIDTTTIILTSFALNVLLVLLLAIYYQHQKKETHNKMFFGAKVFQTLAFAVWGSMAFIRIHGYTSWSLFAGSVLLLVSIFFESLAVLLLINARKEWTVKVYSIAIASFSSAYILAYYQNTTQNFRLVLFSFFAISLFTYPMILLFQKRKELAMQRVAGTIYLLMMALFVLRGLVAGGLVTGETSLQNQLQSWILYLLFVFMILANCGYLFLTKVRADIKLIQLANCDELTNILNRRAFNEISERAIQYCARKNEPVTFIIFDIDNFKKVNDTFGHFVGDMVLIEVASVVQSRIRAYDFFGRYGGDEFGLFMPGTSGEEAIAMAKRLLHAIESKNLYKHTKLRVTVSMGMVSVMPTSDTCLETLYQLADGALYDAKMEGGNCVKQPVQVIREGVFDG